MSQVDSAIVTERRCIVLGLAVHHDHCCLIPVSGDENVFFDLKFVITAWDLRADEQFETDVNILPAIYFFYNAEKIG